MLMYICKLDKRISQVDLYGNLSLIYSRLFSAARDFSRVAESFDRSIHWIELDYVDISPVSFKRAVNYSFFVRIRRNHTSWMCIDILLLFKSALGKNRIYILVYFLGKKVDYWNKWGGGDMNNRLTEDLLRRSMQYAIIVPYSNSSILNECNIEV